MRARRSLLGRIAGDLASLSAFVWPGPCAACGDDLPAESVAGICPSCWAGLPVHEGVGCARCALPAAAPLTPGACPDCRALGGETALKQTVAALIYQDAAITLHRRLKFEGATDLAAPLARRMAAAWRRCGDAPADLVVPIPPDPLRWTIRRRAPRALAARIARILATPHAPRALRKVRATPALTGATGAERRRRLSGAFCARAELIAGQVVLVVDDVATTGATLHEAARALSAAGAAAVAALVLARTPRRG